MLKSILYTLTILITLSSQAFAGVIVEMVSKDLASSQESPADRMYAQGEMLRMESSEEDGGHMIFRDGAMLIINHSEKSFYRMDENSMAQVSSQMSEAMKQMQEQMAQLPPEQRAMMEKMMKGRMPAGMSPQTSSPLPELRMEATGKNQVSEYSCEMWEVFRGEEKIRELCAVSIDDLGGIAEAMEAFKAMAGFSRKMMESVQQMPFANIAENPYQFMDQLDGFPVLTREFKDGRAISETLLKSVTQETLDENLFQVPKGYRELDPFNRDRGR